MTRYLNIKPPRVALAFVLACGAAAPHASHGQGFFNGAGGIVSISDSVRYVRGDVENGGEFGFAPASGKASSRLFIDEGDLLNAATGKWDAGRSTVVLLGMQPHKLGMHGATLYNLRLDNPAGTTLSSDATVAAALKLANGHLSTTEVYSLRLAATGAVYGPGAADREDDAHYVKGSLVQQQSLAGADAVDFGHMGVVVNPQGQRLTLTVDRRTGLDKLNYSYATSREFTGKQSIDRIWRFSTADGQDPRAAVTLTLNWLADNDHGIDFGKGMAQVWRSTNRGASWVREGAPQSGVARSVTVATTRLNAWYTVSNTQPAPKAEQLVFTAAPRQLDAVLNWSTNFKPENGWYIIERSKDGQEWREISRQPVAGQDWSPAASTAVDREAGKIAGTMYYRLRQLSTSGATQYSSVLEVRFAKQLEFALEAYPVPLQEYLTLDLTTATGGPMSIELYDMGGRLLLSRQETAPAGASRYQLHVQALPVGLYSLRVRQGGQQLTRTLQRQ